MKIDIPYDFGDVVDAIRPFMSLSALERALEHEKATGEKRNKFAFAQFLLDMPEFPDYAATFFQNRTIWDDIQQLRMLHSADNVLPDHENPQNLAIQALYLDAAPQDSKYFKTPLKAGQTLEKMFQNVQVPQKPVRKGNVYPLTADETRDSNAFLQQEDDLLLAIIGAKYCIASYYEALHEAVDGAIIRNEKFASDLNTDALSRYYSYISLLGQNIKGRSTTEEFAPLLANVLRHAPDSRDQGALRQAFKHLFDRSAFANYSPSDFNPYNQCPFANSFVKAMQLDLRRASDGVVVPMGRSYSGALINFARDEIAAAKAMKALVERPMRSDISLSSPDL